MKEGGSSKFDVEAQAVAQAMARAEAQPGLPAPTVVAAVPQRVTALSLATSGGMSGDMVQLSPGELGGRPVLSENPALNRPMPVVCMGLDIQRGFRRKMLTILLLQLWCRLLLFITAMIIFNFRMASECGELTRIRHPDRRGGCHALPCSGG